MEKLNEVFFPTEVESIRQSYYNAYRNHSPSALHKSIYEKMRQTKSEAMAANNAYHRVLKEYHSEKKAYEAIIHNTFQKRMKFLHLYSNKKFQLKHDEMLHLKKKQEKQRYAISLQNTKRKKLQNQLRSILKKKNNEEEMSRLRGESKLERQKYKIKKKQKDFLIREANKEQFQKVKKEEAIQFAHKNSLRTSMQMKAKHNYLQKMNNQIQLMRQYEDLLVNLDESDRHVRVENKSQKGYKIIESPFDTSLGTANNDEQRIIIEQNQ